MLAPVTRAQRAELSRIRAGRAPRSAVVAVVLGAAALGYLYGWATQLVPGVVDPASFWVGNLAAPYLALPFLAGAAAASVRGGALAAAAGALADVGAVAGFYELHSVGQSTGPGNPTGIAAYARWFSTFLLGVPGGMPWLTLALAVGAVLGLVGAAWFSRPRRWWLAAPVAAAFVLEPPVTVTAWRALLEWRLGTTLTPYRLDGANLVIWGTEIALGILALVAVIVVARRDRRPAG